MNLSKCATTVLFVLEYYYLNLEKWPRLTYLYKIMYFPLLLLMFFDPFYLDFNFSENKPKINFKIV